MCDVAYTVVILFDPVQGRWLGDGTGSMVTIQ